MDKTLSESTGLVWHKRSLYSAFSVLKALYQESKQFCILFETTNKHFTYVYARPEWIISWFPEFKDLISPDGPDYEIVQKFNYGQNREFTLISSINDSMLLTVALSFCSALPWHTFLFSDLPDNTWLEKYLQDLYQSNNLTSVTLKHWQTLLNNFKFSSFALLPDWDIFADILLISKNEKLFNTLMAIEPNLNRWKSVTMDMFAPD